MDFFSEFMAVKDRQFLSGKYYKVYPQNYTDCAEEFSYEEIDPKDRTYSKLLSNLQTDGATFTIKTKTPLDYAVKGYVLAQDGTMYQIAGVVKKTQQDDTENALRLFRETNQTEWVIRLLMVENPMELK